MCVHMIKSKKKKNLIKSIKDILIELRNRTKLKELEKM